jgi:hypothetical protein
MQESMKFIATGDSFITRRVRYGLTLTPLSALNHPWSPQYQPSLASPASKALTAVELSPASEIPALFVSQVSSTMY